MELMSWRHYRWYLVGLLTAIAGLNYADRAALSSVLPLIRGDLRMSPVMLGAAGSAFLWVYAVCSPGSGYLADRLPRSRMIIWSISLWSVVTVLTGFVYKPWQMLAARALLGAAECVYVPAAIALTAEYHERTTRAWAIGIQLAGYNVGVVLGGVFSGYIGDHWGWRPAFWILGAAGLVLALIARATLPRDDARHRPEERSTPVRLRESLRTLFAVPTFNIVLLESTCISAGAWIFLVWLPLYFKETFSLSLAAAGIAGTLGLQTAATSASLAGGFFSDRFAGYRRERRMLFQFLCFACATPFLIAFFRHPSLGAASMAILLFAFFRSLGSSNDNVILCDVLPQRVWSTAVGVTNATNSAAGALGVLLTGYLEQYFGLGGVFGGLCITVAIAACLVLIGYRYYMHDDLARAETARGVINASPGLNLGYQ
jgi:predicted MFS family arabinose efflux permease